MSNPLADIQTIYVSELSGEPQFGRRLVRALQEMGRFELIEDRTRADAMLSAYGADEGEGFVGDLKLHALNGDVLWSAHATRPHGSSGPMAYERLLNELRAALAASDEQSRAV